MFIAETKNGERYSLVEPWLKQDLEELRNHQQMFCPVCKQAVQLKLGEQRVWHFAHLPNSECKLQLENETVYHLQGKQKLYYWIKAQGLKVELEPYLHRIRQRPDLLTELNGRKYAIEYQCSTIPAEQLIRRTLSYKQERIQPIWILGGKRLKRESDCIISPSTYDLLMSYQANNKDMQLIYFCPLTNQFAIATSMYSFSSGTAVTPILFQSLNQANFSFSALLNLSNHNNSNLIFSWLKLKKKWRATNYLYTDRYWKNWYYTRGYRLPLLPAEAGVPLASMLWIKTHVMLWQGWVLLNFIQPRKIGELISFHEVYESFNHAMHRGKFEVRKLPGVRNSHYSFAIMNYLQYLVRVGVLKQGSCITDFQKIKDVTIPKNINEACENDKEITKLSRD